MQEVRGVCEIYRKLLEVGLNGGTTGNASIRHRDGFLITPHGACPLFMTGSDLVRCSLVEAPSDASEDWKIHAEVYKRTDASCVLHAHSPYTVALSRHLMDYVVFTRMSRDVRLNNPHWIGNALHYEPVVVISDHGVYAKGKDPLEAFCNLLNLEQECKIRYLQSNIWESQKELTTSLEYLRTTGIQ